MRCIYHRIHPLIRRNPHGGMRCPDDAPTAPVVDNGVSLSLHMKRGLNREKKSCGHGGVVVRGMAAFH